MKPATVDEYIASFDTQYERSLTRRSDGLHDREGLGAARIRQTATSRIGAKNSCSSGQRVPRERYKVEIARIVG